MRQAPSFDEDRMMRSWRAWGICTSDGTLAELTMDPAKAAVWSQGGHKVIGFLYEEPYDPIRESAQGRLL